jgi:hypothetical protein
MPGLRSGSLRQDAGFALDQRKRLTDISKFGGAAGAALASPDTIVPGSQQGSAQSQISYSPPWIQRIASAQDYFLQADGVALGAGPALTVTPAALTYVLPRGWRGQVSGVTIFIDAPTTSLDVNFTLLYNGVPVPGFTNLRSFPRAATNLSIDFSGPTLVPVGSTISMNITNNNASTWTVGASVTGWIWPVADEQRLFGDAFAW